MNEEIDDAGYDATIDVMRRIQPYWRTGGGSDDVDRNVFTPPYGHEPREYIPQDTSIVFSGAQPASKPEDQITETVLWNVSVPDPVDHPTTWAVSNLGTIRYGWSLDTGDLLTITNNSTSFTPSNGDYVYLKILATVLAGTTSTVTVEHGTWTEHPELIKTTGTNPNKVMEKFYYPIWKYTTADGWTRLAENCHWELITRVVENEDGYMVVSGDMRRTFYTA